MGTAGIAIVGAGIAGLTAGQWLQQRGYRVTLLEKSRGLGGRMATRRTETALWDHGARYLSAQLETGSDPEAAGAIADLITAVAPALTPWSPHPWQISATTPLAPAPPLAAPYWVAPAGLSSLGKSLATGLTLHRRHRVTGLQTGTTSPWQLTGINEATGQPFDYPAAAILLALPAPQILPILAPLALPAAALAPLAAVTYAPCLAVLAAYDPQGIPPTDPLGIEEGWIVRGSGEDCPLNWVALESSKRPGSRPTVVFQSSAAFAQGFLDCTDLAIAAQTLLSWSATHLAPWLGHPTHWQIHRWRYSQVTQPSPQPVWVGPTALPGPLLACGDWGGPHRIATARLSAIAAATHLGKLLA